MKRVPPSERTKGELAALFSSGTAGDPQTELVRLAVRQIVEEALEATARDVLQRDYYARSKNGEQGWRNGYREGRLATAEGEVRYSVPQLREADDGALGALRRSFSGRTEALEDLAVEMYARGLSTRDIEACFRDEEGRSLLTRTAVSEVTERLWTEYEAFATRDLSEVHPLYLFLDGVAERLRPGTAREAVLSAWAITWEGKKVLIHLAPGTKESTECCREFLEEMRRRGLADPVLVCTDGAPGLIRAVEECFPASLRQRCLAHKVRNIVDKLPERAEAEVKEAVHAAYRAPSLALARVNRDDVVARYERRYPAAVRCFLEDFEACVAHLNLPPAHRRVCRTTNLLERLFVEERRRSRAAGTMLAGERAVMKLMFAALIRASETWRGIRISEFERRQLERLAEQLKRGFQEEHQAIVRESTPIPIYSSERT